VAVWAVLIGWQVAEHVRIQRADKTRLINRANVASDTLAVVVKSLNRFGIINRTALESSLEELIKPAAELTPTSVVLLNATNGLVASAGPPVAPGIQEKLLDGEFSGNACWDDDARTVTILHPVDLGTNFASVVLAPGEARRPFLPGTNFPAGTNATGAFNGPPPADDANPAEMPPAFTNSAFRGSEFGTNPTPPPGSEFGRRGGRGGGRGGPGDFSGPRRPLWMTEAEYERLKNEKGVHGFILVMPAAAMITEIRHDLWLRVFICILATISVAGYGLAWGNLSKTSVLQIRLVRQSELNSHLKEMNLAAAGLAHETRNPLNIIRGLAQMISRRDDASPEVRVRSREIIDETDRITAQLNEFINYSRPREVRRASVNVNALAADVVRALNYDLEEKKVQIRVLAEPLTIQADEQLLRQALFNLVINAIQAVPASGEIWIRAGRTASSAFIEVADNGPGVAPEHRAELFKPYFTTHEEGTGLGLAVVQQIVLAHGWEIACLPNQPSGAIFRITHIRASGKP
jgi:signal transduction histidine kinase